MKLRLRGNSIRLRLNRREVAELASGAVLTDRVDFPGDRALSYILEASAQASPQATFCDSAIRVCASKTAVEEWAAGNSIGIYFELPANGTVLKVAIEKDLECIDGPLDERDPEAFPRASQKNC